MTSIRGMIAQVLGLTGMALKEIDAGAPARSRAVRPIGHPGRYGDFTSMLWHKRGAHLLLQMLRRWLAGVWDHSISRDDIFGRLRRTASLSSATTFGTTIDAERLIAKGAGQHSPAGQRAG